MTRYNWSPDPLRLVYLDFETQSACNLKVAGAKAYLRHPSTRVLSLAAKRGRQCVIWVPEGRAPRELIDAKLSLLWPDGFTRGGENIALYVSKAPPDVVTDWVGDNTFVAHNVSFDANAWRELVAKPFGVMEPEWFDTLSTARAAGLPGGLDALGNIFLGRGKDDGAAALKLLYTAKVKNGDVVYPVGTVPLWQKVLRYNVADVLLLERIYDAVRQYAEVDVLRVDSTINARGVAVDLPFLSRLVDLWTEQEKHAQDEVSRLTGGELNSETIRSVPRVKAWLRKYGVQVDSINRQVLERLYEYPEEFFAGDDSDNGSTIDECHHLVCQVLKLRQGAVRIGKSKLQRIADVCDGDGRVRDVLVYHGAHTGRWSGRVVQPHNFTRGVGGLDVQALADAGVSLSAVRSACDVVNAAERAKNPDHKDHSIDDALSTLTRPVFVAAPGKMLLICDYAAVEARGVAWCAGQHDLVDIFAAGGDVYKAMASKIFGVSFADVTKQQRFIGKETVLGCGYSLGAPKFAAYCKLRRIDLAAAGTSAEACVEMYRDAYPKIAGVLSGKFRRGGLWKDVQRAAMGVVEKPTRTHVAGRCRFYCIDGHLNIELPSGRRLIYRNTAVEDVVPPYCKALGLPEVPKPTLTYSHPHRSWRASLYGGLITENIVQAVCRDLLAHSLVACEAAGLCPVLHVHDEIVCEVDDVRRLRDLALIMATPPAWAKGFPVGVEGFSCQRYVKSPFKSSHRVEARMGQIT